MCDVGAHGPSEGAQAWQRFADFLRRSRGMPGDVFFRLLIRAYRDVSEGVLASDLNRGLPMGDDAEQGVDP